MLLRFLSEMCDRAGATRNRPGEVEGLEPGYGLPTLTFAPPSSPGYFSMHVRYFPCILAFLSFPFFLLFSLTKRDHTIPLFGGVGAPCAKTPLMCVACWD